MNIWDQFDDRNQKCWDKKLWEKACSLWNREPTTRENVIVRKGRAITINDIISFDVFLARSIFPIREGTLYVGFGVPTPENGIDRSKPHWLCRDDRRVISHESSAVSQSVPLTLSNIQVTLNVKKNRLIIGNCGVPIKVIYCRNLEEAIKEQIQVIAFIRTPFGNVNLIPMKGVPTLKTLAAYKANTGLRNINDINTLGIPSECQESLKCTWIQTHATILIPDSFPFD